MGFCLFNNIAIAAAHGIAAHGLERVMIVDWDVHHGNGTQHIFEDRSDVLFVSTHQWPLWPGSGAVSERGRGEGRGFTINLPLPAGFGDGGSVAVFESIILPAADRYRPRLLLISAGFDAHRDDPLAGMAMTERGFAKLCAMLHACAARHCEGRIALVLEGGYNLEALAASALACVRVLGDPQARAAAMEDAPACSSAEAMVARQLAQALTASA
jgi:acetoin utilization deacetylase AcuC-like enzyme